MQTIQDELGIPAVTAMYKENPGVELYRKHVAIVKTANNARAMKTDQSNDSNRRKAVTE